MSRILDRIVPPGLGRPFRWLLASSWISSLGDGFSLAAGPLLVASYSRNPLLVSLGALSQWLPGFAVGLYAGALSDRVDRRALALRMNLFPLRCEPGVDRLLGRLPPHRRVPVFERSSLGNEATVQEVLNGVQSVRYVPLQLLKSVEVFRTLTSRALSPALPESDLSVSLGRSLKG